MATSEAALTQQLQELIDYHFKDPQILKEAQTRRAFQNDTNASLDESMDPLATLGDAILEGVVIQHLYEQGIREKGKLTEYKNVKVRRTKTRSFAETHHLPTYIRWGKGEQKDEVWTKGERALDTVTEALIGAVFLDAQKREWNGMSVVEEMLERMKFFELI